MQILKIGKFLSLFVLPEAKSRGIIFAGGKVFSIMSFMKRFFYFTTLLLILCSLFLPVSVLAADTFVGLSAPKSARQGDTIIVNLNSSGERGNLISFGPVTISFDATKFTFKAAEKGAKVTANFTVTATSGAGTVSIQATQASAADVIPSGIFTLVTLTFEVKPEAAVGATAFTLDNVTGFKTDDNPDLPVIKNPPVSVELTKKLSSDATLSSLSVEGYPLSSVFTPAMANGYAVTVPNTVTSVKINAKTAHPAAKIDSVTGYNNLKLGENLVQVNVTAEDGKTKNVYSVRVLVQSEVVSTVVSSEPEPETVISTPTENNAPVAPVDELTSLQKKYDLLEEKLVVVIVLFIIVIAALLCYIVYLLIKARN